MKVPESKPEPGESEAKPGSPRPTDSPIDYTGSVGGTDRSPSSHLDNLRVILRDVHHVRLRRLNLNHRLLSRLRRVFDNVHLVITGQITGGFRLCAQPLNRIRHFRWL